MWSFVSTGSPSVRNWKLGSRSGYSAELVANSSSWLLSSSRPNVIAVRVYDERLTGGIYQGPIGLMTEDNYDDYRRKHKTGRGFWDYVFDAFGD